MSSAYSTWTFEPNQSWRSMLSRTSIATACWPTLLPSRRLPSRRRMLYVAFYSFLFSRFWRGPSESLVNGCVDSWGQWNHADEWLHQDWHLDCSSSVLALGSFPIIWIRSGCQHCFTIVITLWPYLHQHGVGQMGADNQRKVGLFPFPLCPSPNHHCSMFNAHVFLSFVGLEF